MKNRLIISASIVILALAAGCNLTRPLGQNPQGDDLARLQALPNYKNGKFQNEVARPPAPITRRRGPRWLFMFRSKRETVTPSYKMPWVKVNLKALPTPAPTVVWFGHSSALVKTVQANILIDPIFSNHAGPVPGMVKAFKGTMHYNVNDMPPIDVVIISHDHYDHMDYRTLVKLKDKAKRFIVPMGAGSHLRYWGIAADKITELNWHQSTSLPGQLTITATPAQHRSNRTFNEESKTLWASYVIQAGSYKLFYSGDGGYGPHFKEIGKRYGGFDLALLECGQYSVNWPYTHMMPEQTAQAAADLQARLLQPLHWAKFAEADHPWNEPMQRLLPAAQKLNMPVSVPRLGEPYTIGEGPKNMVWWDFE